MQVDQAISRRKFLKRTLQGLAGTFVFGSALAGYARTIEPYWLKVSKRTILLPNLPKAFQSLRLMHMTDIHYFHPVKKNKLAEMFQSIKTLKPDVICFTGDLADHQATPIKELVPLLSELQAPLGKFAINGNHDLGHPDLLSVWKKSGFVYLENAHEVIERHGESLAIAGVEYLHAGVADHKIATQTIRQSLQGLTQGICTILLAHCPDYADQAKRFPIDLQLSGHSHGGQVKLPFIGPLYYVYGAKKYVEGLYKWNDSQMQLYVDRGIGCSMLPLRFLCRPQMTLTELKRA